jgi:aerobic carbon-monoxide dehydrogenase medium subunit
MSDAGSFSPSLVLQPSSIDEALKMLGENGDAARIVAGNTMIHDLAGHGALANVQVLIDISNLGLSYLKNDGTLKVGAATTFTTISESPLAYIKGLEALGECASKITPPQVRNMGTIGGSLCSGVPFLDMPTAIVALDPIMVVQSRSGSRRIESDSFFIDYFQTAVGQDEILVELEFRQHSDLNLAAGSSFAKMGRTEVDFAIVNVSTYLEVREDGKECVSARVALGAVANTPIRWKELEANLIGRRLSLDGILSAIKETKVSIEPTPMIHASPEYKKLIIPVLARDSLFKSLSRIENSRNSKS